MLYTYDRYEHLVLLALFCFMLLFSKTCVYSLQNWKYWGKLNPVLRGSEEDKKQKQADLEEDVEVVTCSARKLQIQSGVVSTPKISWEADWEHSVRYLCHLLPFFLLLANSNCQGQNTHLDGVSV